MKEFDSFEDFGKLLNLNSNIIDKFKDNLAKSVAHEVLDSCLSNEVISKHDIGIGSLIIKNDGETLTYKFVPNDKFENMLINAIQQQKSPLVNGLEKRLSETFYRVYKELI